MMWKIGVSKKISRTKGFYSVEKYNLNILEISGIPLNKELIGNCNVFLNYPKQWYPKSVFGD